MASESRSGWGGGHGIAFAVVLWLIVASSVFYFFVYGQPELASDRGYVDTLYYVIFGLTGAAYILYQIAFGWVILRYRGDRPEAASSYWNESHRLEMTWMLGTAVILIPIALTGLAYWDRITAPAPEGSIEVMAVGAQFQWDFQYPGADGEFGAFSPTLYAIDNQIGLDESDPAAGDDWVLTNQLVLPVDRPARILLRSKDVQHSFFLPNFRVKQDLVPGMTTEVWFTPIKVGEYEIACAELCGLGHYRMRAFLTVMEAADYEEWLASNAPTPEVVAPEAASPDEAPEDDGPEAAPPSAGEDGGASASAAPPSPAPPADPARLSPRAAR